MPEQTESSIHNAATVKYHEGELRWRALQLWTEIQKSAQSQQQQHTDSNNKGTSAVKANIIWRGKKKVRNKPTKLKEDSNKPIDKTNTLEELYKPQKSQCTTVEQTEQVEYTYQQNIESNAPQVVQQVPDALATFSCTDSNQNHFGVTDMITQHGAVKSAKIRFNDVQLLTLYTQLKTKNHSC